MNPCPDSPETIMAIFTDLNIVSSKKVISVTGVQLVHGCVLSPWLYKIYIDELLHIRTAANLDQRSIAWFDEPLPKQTMCHEYS